MLLASIVSEPICNNRAEMSIKQGTEELPKFDPLMDSEQIEVLSVLNHKELISLLLLCGDTLRKWQERIKLIFQVICPK